MKLQLVAVSETGASELLPLHPETLRVFPALEEERTDGKSRRSDVEPSQLPTPKRSVRHSRARVVPTPG